MNNVRVRFAPSPTGFLHIGGVRTALFNWLYARHFKGKFLLRIEDTDLERSEDRYTKDILASMKWLGLQWDEEPLYQSKRLELYRQKTEELVQKGLAYRCSCTEAEVEAMRAEALAAGKKPKYNGRCRDRSVSSKDGPFVVRAKLPEAGHIEFHDLIRGDIRVENSELDDFVLLRSNGAPTYNLSVVVDDVESQMTHIIRGDDHINNTPKQVHLYRFFKYTEPKFAHLPMILGPDKKKLSKRHGAVSANVYREEGYLPEALLGFLVRMGWSHGDQEIFTIEEMIQLFSFDHVQKSSAVFNLEKLQWLNGSHIRSASGERLRDILLEDFQAIFDASSLKNLRGEMGIKLVMLAQPKVKLLKEMAQMLAPLLSDQNPALSEVDLAALKWNKDPELKSKLKVGIQELIAQLGQLLQGKVPTVTHTEVENCFKGICEKQALKLGDLAQPLRLCVSGRAVSLGLFDTLAVVPWEITRPRLEKALEL